MVKWIDSRLRGNDIIYKVINLLILSYFIFIPLLLDTSAKSNFSTPKLFALRIITLFIILILGLRIFFEKKIYWRKNILNWLFLIFGFLGILSTIFSVNIYSSFYGYPAVFYGIFTIVNLIIVYFIFAHLIRDEKPVISILNISVITAVAASIYGFLQYFNVIDVSGFSQSETGRIFSTLGHANHFGAYLGMNLLIALGLIFAFGKKKKYYLLYIFAIFLFIASIFLTASRGALLAVVISMIFFFVILFIWHFSVIRKNIKKFTVISGIIILILALSICLNYQKISSLKIFERIKTTVEAIQKGDYPDRISWALSAFEMIKEKPLIGFGVSTFNDIYNKYRRTDYKVPGDIQDEITPENAHNDYLTLAIEQGLPALIIFLLIIIIFFHQTLRTIFQNKKNILSICLLGILSAILVHLIQVLLSFGVVATLTPFFAFLGLGSALNSIINNNKPKLIKIKYRLYYVIFALSVVIFVFGAYFAVTQYLADRYIKEALREEGGGHFEDSFYHYEIANRLMRENYFYYNLEANSAFNAYSITQDKKYLNSAKEKYLKAVKINNLHPSTYANLGLVYYSMYKIDQNGENLKSFKEQFEKAIELSPNNPLYSYKYGEILYDIKDYDPAKKMFEKTLKIRTPYKYAEKYLEKIDSHLRGNDSDNASCGG
jgi:O-antigen ligase